MSDRNHFSDTEAMLPEHDESLSPANGGGHESLNGLVSRRGTDSRREGLAGYTGQGTAWNRNPDDAEGIDFVQILGMLVRRRKIIIATFLLVVGATLAATMLSRPIYEAKATVLVNTAPKGSSPGASFDLEMVGGLDSISPMQIMETQVAIIDGPPVRKGALKRLSDADLKAIKDYNQVIVEPQARTALVNVTVRSHDRNAAAALATAICEEYIAGSQRQNREQMRSATDYVGNELARVKKGLVLASTKLKKFKEQNLVTDINAEGQAMVSQVSQIQTELRSAQLERSANLAQAQSMRAMVAQLPIIINAQENIAKNTGLTDLNNQLSTLQTKRRELLAEYVPGSEPVRDVEKQIAEVRGRIASTQKTEVQGFTKVPNPLREQLRQSIQAAEAAARAATAKIASLQVASVETRGRLSKTPDKQFRLSQLETEAATLQQASTMLANKYQELLITVNGQQADANLVFPAISGRNPVSPKLTRSLLVAGMLGLLLSLALAALVDRLDDKVHSDAETEQLTHLPVLVQVPFLENPRESTLLYQGQLNAGGEKGSTLMETYRMLRTNIVFSATDKPIHSLVVTSSMPGEGKSSNSVNLAVAAAMSGEDVILVDCDLRRPMLHRVCGLPNNIGVSNVLAGSATLDEALQQSAVPGLRVLTSGPTPPNPFKMLNSKAGRTLMQQLQKKARFVLIDTPPALGLADAQVLAAQADATLMVVSCRDTKRREMTRTRDLLMQTGTELLGIVLTKVPVEAGGYYSYMGYYQYKHYRDYLKAGAEGAAEETAAIAKANSQAALNGQTASSKEANKDNHA